MAQRGRLDDQRGTEINFEMPDFLKRGQVRGGGGRRGKVTATDFNSIFKPFISASIFTLY